MWQLNVCLCMAVERRWMHIDRERGEGGGEGVGWVKRQIQIGVVV